MTEITSCEDTAITDWDRKQSAISAISGLVINLLVTMTHPRTSRVNDSVGKCLHTPVTGQNTCRIPAYPCHWTEYLQDTCIPLSLDRIPAGYLHTHDTGHDPK